MRIASVEVMREIDRIAIEEVGIPASVLMENAALACLKHLDLSRSYYVIVCGRGNNGGDGFAMARHLSCLGKEVDVFYMAEGSPYSEETGVNFEILSRLGVSLTPLMKEESLWSFSEALSDADVVVDALLGTGTSRPVTGLYQTVIDLMNDNAGRILSVDVPSGLDADSGNPMGSTILAEKTVTFQCYKRGFLNYASFRYLGETVVERIGIPEAVEEKAENFEYLTDFEWVRQLIPRREKTGFKGDYGKVLVVAGSPGFTGAALICTEAALSSGSGLVTLCSHEEVFDSLVLRLKEAMSLPPARIEDGVRKSDVVVFGPGLGDTERTFELLLRVVRTLQEERKPESVLLLDADGLNVLEDRAQLLSSMGFRVILTPHPGEMARLTGLTTEEVVKDRIDVARDFAKKSGCVVLLKGYHTVITDGEKVYINPTGSSSMAQGGMGDALSGIIGSLSGQGIDPFHATVLGAYLHGYIGDSLSEERYTVKASEVIANIPVYLKRILES
jgi:NAD(P)H-hydrate epimerase